MIITRMYSLGEDSEITCSSCSIVCAVGTTTSVMLERNKSELTTASNTAVVFTLLPLFSFPLLPSPLSPPHLSLRQRSRDKHSRKRVLNRTNCDGLKIDAERGRKRKIEERNGGELATCTSRASSKHLVNCMINSLSTVTLFVCDFIEANAVFSLALEIY